MIGNPMCVVRDRIVERERRHRDRRKLPGGLDGGEQVIDQSLERNVRVLVALRGGQGQCDIPGGMIDEWTKHVVIPDVVDIIVPVSDREYVITGGASRV